MENFRIDLTFVNLHYEIWALEEYYRLITQHFKTLEEREKNRLHQRLKELDWDEQSLATQEYEEIIENILPKQLFSSFLVTAWAVYESVVIDIAKYIKGGDISEELGNIKGSRVKNLKDFIQII